MYSWSPKMSCARFHRHGFHVLIFLKAFALVLVFASAPKAIAQLVWTKKQQTLTAAPEDVSAKAAFPFKNTGSRPITVRGVQTSCGCTTADFTTKTYGPGESGEIRLIFTFGGRIGDQKKTAKVLTDDPASDAELQLAVTIPQLSTLTPGVLYWKKGEALAPKSVSLVINYPQPVKITGVTSSDPAIKATFEPQPGGNSFRIVAIPEPAPAQDASPMVKSLLTIETDLPIPGKSSFMVYALVKR